VAVGERRPSLAAPTRSMVLGLVGACLGVRRDDLVGQASLAQDFGVATRTDAEGVLLVDYHTAQAPDGPRISAFRRRTGRLPATRREELRCTVDAKGNPAALETQLSQRQYRCDSAFAIALWLRREPAAWSLERVAEALASPTFIPFAGRRSAALALPFQPLLLDAEDPVAALRVARFSLDDLILGLLKPKWQGGGTKRTFRWEGDWKGLVPDRTETRRDQVVSRSRWQFIQRDEHVLVERVEAEATDVVEPA
ncbi:MAG TPA: type I-E CRISPR-associated protein Cas5/CasD, partial [Fimbriimonas sp.]